MRRATRSQISRSHHGDHGSGHGDQFASQVNEVAQGMLGLGFPNSSGDMGYYNNPHHHHSSGIGHPIYPSSHHHQYQHQSYHHHNNDFLQHSQDEPMSSTSSGRTLRTRTAGGTVTAPATSTTQNDTVSSSSSGRRGMKRGTQPTSTPVVYMDDSESDDDVANGDSDNERDSPVPGPSSARGKSTAKSKKGQQSQNQSQSQTPAQGFQMDTALTVDQMVQNCLYYLLLMQHKKVPLKRSDLIKNAMNSQQNQFAEVISKLEEILNDVYGLNLVRLGKGKDNKHASVIAKPTDEELVDGDDNSAGRRRGKGGVAESYMLVSKFPSSVCDSVARRDPEVDSKKTVLYLVLSTIFMLNRGIDDETIWKIICDMQLDEMVCSKKSDLRKFLKSEFVSSGYLNMELSTPNHPNLSKYSRNNNESQSNTSAGINEDLVAAKYTWGPRAEMEYSKLAMLKFVTSRFPGKRIYEFSVQFGMLSKEEKALVEKELADVRETDADNETPGTSGESGSALHIKQKKGGKEVFTIDGSAEGETETETEDS